MTDWVNVFYESWPLALLSALLITGAVIDCWKLKVPNWLTFGMMLSGLGLAGWWHGWSGLGASLALLVFGFVLLWPVYAIGGMGRGRCENANGIRCLDRGPVWLDGGILDRAVRVLPGGGDRGRAGHCHDVLARSLAGIPAKHPRHSQRPGTGCELAANHPTGGGTQTANGVASLRPCRCVWAFLATWRGVAWPCELPESSCRAGAPLHSSGAAKTDANLVTPANSIFSSEPENLKSSVDFRRSTNRAGSDQG
jgi:hypothetical protein